MARRGRVIAELRRNTQSSPEASFSRISSLCVCRPSRLAWISWTGGSSDSSSRHGTSLPFTTFLNSHQERYARSAPWSARTIAISMSLCDRVTRPRKRSTAHPPAMNHGRSNFPIRSRTFIGSSKAGTFVDLHRPGARRPRYFTARSQALTLTPRTASIGRKRRPRGVGFYSQRTWYYVHDDSRTTPKRVYAFRLRPELVKKLRAAPPRNMALTRKIEHLIPKGLKTMSMERQE